MKKFFFGFTIFMTLQINAQNYLITFEAAGESNSVSTVKVENMTAGTSLTLSGSDILSLTFTSRIDPMWDHHYKLKIYPNPMVDNSNLEFFPPVAGDATITISDITGRPITQVHSYLENYMQSFRLSGLKQGFYLITVVGHNYQFSGKLVSNGESNGTISIAEVIYNTQAVDDKQMKSDVKGVQATIDMEYSQGEMLRFTGSSGQYSKVVMDIPTSNKRITFNFTGVPTLTTRATTEISSATAISGGTVTGDGSASVTARGVCWSTSSNPTVALSTKTSNGTGTGSFTSNITGLQPVTSYHVRAYATNSEGTSYGANLTFTTSAIVPSLTTIAASDITRTTATAGGNISSDGGATVSNSGICWSTSHNPSITGSHTSDGTADGSFTSSLTGLLANTLYFIRAYATNDAGTSYGNELSFTTDPIIIPKLTTTIVSSITSVTAISGGNITDNGGASITARGVCWATSSSPTISDAKTSNGTGKGSYSSNITGLQPVTTYHVRAYATNSAGTAYGNDLTFTTSAIVPSLTTTEASSITRTTATSGGHITSNGGATVSNSGICWSTSHNPSITESHTSDGTATGSFTSSMTGLSGSTLYYIRAYATNSAGTSYGNELSFTTNPALISTLSTSEITSVTSTTAVSGGNITNDGDGNITARGICWATTSSPTVSDNLTSNGTGTGTFTSNITGLQAVTTYHVRAYATNSAGTAYGNEVLFTTDPVQIASLTTTEVTSTSPTTAISGGTITNDGGSSISARGICWATTPSPTISDNLTSDGIGTGSFTSNITGLQPLATYHVRAYATNSAGTAYGNDLTFTAVAVVPTVTTAEVSAITQTSATSGGNVTANGGASVTARGVCWGTSTNPTIINNKTTNGTGTGSFISNLTGFIPNTLYYMRAYATNNVGTAYGNEVTFMYILPEIGTCKWLNDSPCFLNLSFDDSQEAHLDIANLLDQYGFKGTFYVVTNAFGISGIINTYNNIASSGHEIGSHTENHPELTSISVDEINYEIDESVSKINSFLNINCTSFAHPYHLSNNSINNIIFNKNLFTRNYSEYYSSERPRFGLTSETQINDLTNFIDEQIVNKSSCLIAGHGIDGSGYSPSTTEFFNELLTYIKSVQTNNKVWVTTMSNGALYESLFYGINLTSQIDQLNHQIRIQFNYPDKAIYNKFNELLFSFKINKSSSWSMQNSGIEYTESDTHYIYTIDLKQTNELTLHYNISE